MLAVLAIAEIVVDGNRKTRDATVIELADLRVGDPWSTEVRDRAYQELVTSGLFTTVTIAGDPVAGGVRVAIEVRDKHSWVIAPALYAQPTNRGIGLGFGENNLLGRAEKLLLYGQVATGDSFFLGAYIDPSIRGSRWHWALDTYLRASRVIEYAPPKAWRDDPRPVRRSVLRYDNLGVRGGLELRDGASFDLRLRAARVSFASAELVEGATLADVTDDPGATEVPRPGGDGWDVSSEAIAVFDDRANWWGVQDGTRVAFSYEHSLPGVSDFTYWYSGVTVLRGWQLLGRHNLVVRAALGVGGDLPFQHEFTLGGTAHRGLENAQLRGDLRATGGVEYSLPMVSYRGLSLRALGFWDTGYATFLDASPGDEGFRRYLPGADADGWAPLKNSVGLGTRVYLRQVVLPLLGLDFGYGVERRAFEIYLAIGLVE